MCDFLIVAVERIFSRDAVCRHFVLLQQQIRVKQNLAHGIGGCVRTDEEGKTVGEKNTEYVASTTGTSHVIGNSNNFEHPINSGTAESSGTSGNNNNGGNNYYEEIAEECDYVLNKNTKKFHKPSCSSAKQIKDKNREYFTGTREEVLARGFDPCGRCNP